MTSIVLAFYLAMAPAASGNTFAKGRTLYKAQKYSQAEKVLKKFIKTRPKHKKVDDAYWYLGRIKMESQDFRVAKMYFAKVRTATPRSNRYEEASIGLAQILVEQGFYEDAIELLAPLIDVDLSTPDRIRRQEAWAHSLGALAQSENSPEKFTEAAKHFRSAALATGFAKKKENFLELEQQMLEAADSSPQEVEVIHASDASLATTGTGSGATGIRLLSKRTSPKDDSFAASPKLVMGAAMHTGLQEIIPTVDASLDLRLPISTQALRAKFGFERSAFNRKVFGFDAAISGNREQRILYDYDQAEAALGWNIKPDKTRRISAEVFANQRWASDNILDRFQFGGGLNWRERVDKLRLRGQMRLDHAVYPNYLVGGNKIDRWVVQPTATVGYRAARLLYPSISYDYQYKAYDQATYDAQDAAGVVTDATDNRKYHRHSMRVGNRSRIGHLVLDFDYEFRINESVAYDVNVRGVDIPNALDERRFANDYYDYQQHDVSLSAVYSRDSFILSGSVKIRTRDFPNYEARDINRDFLEQKRHDTGRTLRAEARVKLGLESIVPTGDLWLYVRGTSDQKESNMLWEESLQTNYNYQLVMAGLRWDS